MAITQFRFKLKKVSERERRVVDAIHSFLPATGLRDSFVRGIREAVARHVGEAFSFRLDALAYEPYSTYLSRLPQSSVMAVVGMAPLARKAILEIDAPLAMMVVERLLGGQGENMPEPRPLSDTEQGVLEYLILQVLAHVHRVSGKDARVHFRFEKYAFSSHEVRDLAEGSDGVAVLVLRAEIGRYSGFIRLALPDPFVEEGLLDAESPDDIRSAERAWLGRNLARFGYVKTPLWAEAGRTTLAPADLAGLEEGDVILLDQSTVSLAGKMPVGRVILRAGNGMHGGLDADMEIEGTRARCTIAGFHKGE